MMPKRVPRWRKRLRKWWNAVVEVARLAPLGRRTLVILGTFVAGVLDLIGITMMVPLIMAATNLKDSAKGSVVAIRTALEAVGLPFSPIPILVLIVAGLALKAVVSIAVTRYVGSVVATITRDMRIRLIRSLLNARWSYFVRQPIGRLAFAIGPEADAAGQCFENLSGLLALTLQVLLFVTVAALLSWQLLLIAIIAAVVSLAWFGRLVQQGRNSAKEQRRRMRQRSAKFTDALLGIKPIRAMGRTERFAQVFESEARDAADSARAGVLSGEFAADLQEPVIGALLAIGLYVAVSSLTLQVHDVLIMSLLMVKTVTALLPMQRQAQRFIQSHDQYRSLRELLRTTERAKEESYGGLAPRLQQAIRFDRVTFAYGERPVLQALELEIPTGSITAIMGPSGVGKSTIVDLLLGLYRPDGGAVRIDGVDLRDIDLTAWRHGIGYVPQEVLLFHDTVRHNVTLYEEGIPDEAVIEALVAAGAWSFVAELPEGLDTVVGERGNRLSGGQRQRISIARALLHRPRLLILDEATTGLDPETERAVCAQVRKLCAEYGLTVLAVSHQPAWQEAADLVYRIADGEVAQVAYRLPHGRVGEAAAAG
ncbi:ABC transporter ATP-binding protein [Benzoatithermus flavus]|uniref:ABC transporter ATP-binding protein n=1 Tax=Benzoatithermus flavus TaxID=3108223 RepID=A0ABU8XWQ1_9PROT